MKLKTISLGIVLFLCLFLLFFHLFLFFENTPYTQIKPVVENFKLCKICNIIKKVENFKKTLIESYTIKTDDGIKLTNKVNVLLSMLSKVENNSCGKHICLDNISAEEKKVDCTAISGNEMNEIIQMLTEIKNDIIRLTLTDQNTYINKINKIISLIPYLFDQPNFNNLQECKNLREPVINYMTLMQNEEVDRNDFKLRERINKTLDFWSKCKEIHKSLEPINP